MTKEFSILALALALAAPAHAFTPPSPAPTGTGITIPTSETILSISHIALRVTGVYGPCSDQTNTWTGQGTCFEAVMPSGETRLFQDQGGFLARHHIEGYSYAGPDVITVEYVETVNSVSCMPVGPDGCHFHHYRLISQ